jgi:hypothetical protein
MHGDWDCDDFGVDVTGDPQIDQLGYQSPRLYQSTAFAGSSERFARTMAEQKARRDQAEADRKAKRQARIAARREARR